MFPLRKARGVDVLEENVVEELHPLALPEVQRDPCRGDAVPKGEVGEHRRGGPAVREREIVSAKLFDDRAQALAGGSVAGDVLRKGHARSDPRNAPSVATLSA